MVDGIKDYIEIMGSMIGVGKMALGLSISLMALLLSIHDWVTSESYSPYTTMVLSIFGLALLWYQIMNARENMLQKRQERKKNKNQKK